MTALLLHGLADLLTVRHPHGLEFRLHVEARLELADQHIHLHIAGTGEYHLVGLTIVGHAEGGIFFVETAQALGNLILLTADLGHDGHGIAGLGKGNILQRHHLTGIAQGIAGFHLLHLGNGTDIAAGELLDLGGLFAAHDIQASQFLRCAGTGVDHGQIRRQGSGEDLDKGVLAVLVGNGLEHEGRRHAAGRNHEFLRLAVGTGCLVIVAFHGIGQQVHNVVHQHERTHARHSGTAQHREQTQLPHALTQALDHFRIGEILTAEELVHKGFAGLRHRFLQRVIELGNDRFLILRNLDLDPLEILHLESALIEHVDDAGHPLVLIPNGDHHRRDLLAEAFPQCLKRRVIIAVLLIRLGDVYKAGHIPLFAVFPCLLQANGNAVLGRADNHGGVGGPQGLHHFTGKIKSTRGIQNIDPAALVLQRRNGGGDGNLTLDLFGIIVADGISVRHAAHAVNGAGDVNQTFGQGGLPAAAMSQQADIPDVLYRIAHDRTTP